MATTSNGTTCFGDPNGQHFQLVNRPNNRMVLLFRENHDAVPVQVSRWRVNGDGDRVESSLTVFDQKLHEYAQDILCGLRDQDDDEEVRAVSFGDMKSGKQFTVRWIKNHATMFYRENPKSEIVEVSEWYEDAQGDMIKASVRVHRQDLETRAAEILGSAGLKVEDLWA